MIRDEAEARAWLTELPECDAMAIVRLERLVGMLVDENERQNLVSRSSLGEIWRRHIADSAQLLSHVPRGTSGAWVDLGTGAGFPGIVAAILRTGHPVWLIESRTRRIEWLNRVKEALDLSNVDVIGHRLETVPVRTAAIISARAFAPLDKLLDLSFRFSTTDTYWLLPKGASAQHELDSLRGWNHMFHVEQSRTDPQAGIIVGHLRGRKAKAK